MPSPEIDFDTLAKFGLNRFTILVSRGDSGGFKTSTQPIQNDDIIDAMTELLPGSLEKDAAVATMMQDGSLMFDGFHREARPRLAALLRQGRDAYFTNVLQTMYDDTTRRNIARDVAEAIIRGAIEPSELTIEMVCGCDTCSMAADLVNCLSTKCGDLAKNKHVVVPGSCKRLNGDFRQLLDQDIEQRFQSMLKDALAEAMLTVNEELRTLQQGLAIAARFTRQE